MITVHTEGFNLTMELARRAAIFGEPRIGYREYVRYHVVTPDGTVFEGDTYSPSPIHKWDSPMSVIGLLTWICLTPENDHTLFVDYTDEQLNWSRSSDCDYYSGLFGELENATSEDWELNYDPRGMVYSCWYDELEIEIIVQYEELQPV